MVMKTLLLLWCGVSWVLMTAFNMIGSGIIGFLAGGIIGIVLALLLKLFTWGRFPQKIVQFAMVIAFVVAIVFAIAGIFEFMPSTRPK